MEQSVCFEINVGLNAGTMLVSTGKVCTSFSTEGIRKLMIAQRIAVSMPKRVSQFGF